MNIGFKSLFFILCMFLMVACVENSSAENKVDSLLLRNRNFPKDTLSLYIKNYGISKLMRYSSFQRLYQKIRNFSIFFR